MRAVACLFFFLFLVAPLSAESGQEEHNDIMIEGVGFRLFPVRNTGIEFPRLTSYRDKTILNKINKQIDAVTSGFGCDDEDYEGFYEVKVSPPFVAHDILSIYASASYFCGGAYPTNEDNISMTFDLRTGEQIGFPMLFSDYEAKGEQILRIIYAKQVERSEKLGAAGKHGDGSCEEDPYPFSMEHLKESAFDFHFAQDGLHVQPEWPHALQGCAETVVVSYSKLRICADPSGILARMIAN